MSSGTLKNAAHSILCGTNPLVRSREITCRSFLSLLAVCSWCQMALPRSAHPEKPPLPACRKAESLRVTTLKKTFPSTFMFIVGFCPQKRSSKVMFITNGIEFLKRFQSFQSSRGSPLLQSFIYELLPPA